jgi:hypothetical protein
VWTTPGYRKLLEGGPLASIQPGDPVHAVVFNKHVFALTPDGVVPYDEDDDRWPRGLPPADGDAATVARRLTTGEGGLPPVPWAVRFGEKNQHRESRLPKVLEAAAALFEADEARDGVLWILTDNFIDEGEGPDVEANEHFYETLRDDPRWQVAQAWPVSAAPWTCGGTMMVYGLYYSSREIIDGADFDELDGAKRFGSPSIHEAFSEVASAASPSRGEPFRLKPSHVGVVRVRFGGDVVCAEAPPGVPRACDATVVIENLLPHRQLDSGTLTLSNRRLDGLALDGEQAVRVSTVAPLCGGTVRQTLSWDRPVPPGGTLELRTTLEVPAVDVVGGSIPDAWTNVTHDEIVMLGELDATIEKLQSSLVVPPDALASVYGTSKLPEIFRNPRTSDLTARVCASMKVPNPSWLPSLLLLLLLGGGAAVVTGGATVLRPRFRTLRVDGTDRGQLRLSRLGWTPIELDGGTVAHAGLTLGGQPTLRPAKGLKAVRKGNVWEVGDAGRDRVRRIELTHRGSAPSRSSGSSSF